MNRIPFDLQTTDGMVRGYLNIIHPSVPPDILHVMIEKPTGHYYAGQLMYRHGAWVLPDSVLSEYAAELGNLVEVWWE